MKSLLKTLVQGALGIGALYVVGKLCYEAGKEVGEIECQLQAQMPMDKPEDEHPEEKDGRAEEKAEQVQMDLDEEAPPKEKEGGIVGSRIRRTMDKIANMRMFVRAKKAFGGGEKRKPGILATLLNNPDGAKIEAFIKNGSVQINVQPRAA